MQLDKRLVVIVNNASLNAHQPTIEVKKIINALCVIKKLQIAFPVGLMEHFAKFFCF